MLGFWRRTERRAASQVAPVFGDAEADRALRDCGFAVRPFLDADQVCAVQALYDQLAPEAAAEFAATVLSDSFEHRRAVSDGIRAIVGDALRRLLPRYKVAMATFVSKGPRAAGSRLPLHQDWWIVDNRVQPALHVWCPLVDVGVENACLKVVPGVHRLLNDPYPIHPKYRTAYHPELPVLEERFARRIRMRAGWALVYDQRMLHGSDENRSDRLRVAFNCILVPRDLAPRLYGWDPASPRSLEVFEVDEDYLCRFRYRAPIEKPYPAGVRLLETQEAAIHPLRMEDVEALRCCGEHASASKEPEAPTAQTPEART